VECRDGHCGAGGFFPDLAACAHRGRYSGGGSSRGVHAMTTTYLPSALATSPKDQIRMYLGDTDMVSPEMQDEEIMWAYSLRGNTWGATALCALALAAKYSRLTSISADGVSQGLNQKAPAFEKIAVEYQRKEAIYGATAYAGGLTIAEMLNVALDQSRVPDVFRIGMNDNPPVIVPIPLGGQENGIDDIVL
jgi:hypothetical protein